VTPVTGSITDWQDNWHGTATLAAAGGRATTDGTDDYSGVAKAAKLFPIKVLTGYQEVSGGDDVCGDGATISKCWSFDLEGALSGLNKVLQMQNDHTLSDPIVAVNNSYGADAHYADATTCDQDAESAAFLPVIASLKAANIAPIFSSGNSGNVDAGNGQDVFSNQNKVSWPSCITGAISVGASTKTDGMTYYSEAGARTDLVAPGGDLSTNGDDGILLPDQTTGLTAWQGTSFSAPIVAGAWAVARQKNPTTTVDTMKRIFQETGTAVTENRSGYTALTHKRVQLDDALAALTNKPSVTSLTPEGSDFTEGDTVSIDITAPNATTCTLGSNTATITGGTGVITVTATSGSQTYNVVCADGSGYAAQQAVGFVAGASTNFPADPSAGSDGEILLPAQPGVPNTGLALLMSKPAVIAAATVTSAGALLVISRKYAHLGR
jgi:hypothetical protein